MHEYSDIECKELKYKIEYRKLIGVSIANLNITQNITLNYSSI